MNTYLVDWRLGRLVVWQIGGLADDKKKRKTSLTDAGLHKILLPKPNK